MTTSITVTPLIGTLTGPLTGPLVGVPAGTVSWPLGADGALVINGTTVNLPAGSLKDYSSISIINSGRLNITNGTAWTIIGCLGNCTIDATSRIITTFGTATSGTVTATSPNGKSLTHTYGHNNGGFGSYDEDFENDPGGDDGFGHGGGGSTNLAGGNSTISGSGYGADGTVDEFYSEAFGAPAKAALPRGSNGGEGTPFNPSSTYPGDGRGGAGSGGVLGLSGLPLYLKVGGTLSLNNALAIDARGGNGGEGGQGAGGNGDVTGNFYQGGGGGGGSGGNGGKIVLDYHLGSSPATKVAVDGGAGGPGGNGGSGNADDGDAGTNGIKTITVV